ncbi:MAG: hypothetical protein IPL86_11745 [Flavobacteriales bacterium]|nr:hypothetical protein [Flavobacteriales bacterium]
MQEIAFHARTFVFMVLSFSAMCEAIYAFLRKGELGTRWLVSLAPGVLLAVLVAQSFELLVNLLSLTFFRLAQEKSVKLFGIHPKATAVISLL